MGVGKTVNYQMGGDKMSVTACSNRLYTIGWCNTMESSMKNITAEHTVFWYLRQSKIFTNIFPLQPHPPKKTPPKTGTTYTEDQLA